VNLKTNCKVVRQNDELVSRWEPRIATSLLNIDLTFSTNF